MRNLQKEFEVAINLSDDEAEKFIQQLSLSEVREALTLLIQIIESKNSWVVKNAAAIALRDLGDGSAVPVLITAAKNRENRHYNGTLVYALQTLKCNAIFDSLIELAIDAEDDWELVEMAYQALESIEPPVSVHLLDKSEKLVNEALIELKPGDLKTPYLNNILKCIEEHRQASTENRGGK